MARSLSPTRTGHAHIGRARSPSRPRPKASALTVYDSAVLPLLPLYRRLGVEYDCSYQRRLLGGLRPFRKHHEIVEILTCYGDHFDVMTGATGISWRREDRVQTFSWR